jgi:hypothetical protein
MNQSTSFSPFFVVYETNSILDLKRAQKISLVKFRRFTKLLFSFCKILLPSIRQMQMRSCPSVGFEEGDFVWTMLTKDRL